MNSVIRNRVLLLIGLVCGVFWGVGGVADEPQRDDSPRPGEPQSGEMAGYLLVPHTKVSQDYNAGFSMYVAAWPLLQHYPGNRFQTGLFGTWMFAQYPDDNHKDKYSDIEGGLGWWRDTRFATETPKFIMGGVARNFVEWANGPGAGKGRDWQKPSGKYGVAQLSPWILWPPDGLNLKQGTCGELLGYGYLPLPLTEPKATTNGAAVPTGNQSWTLFLNAGNFRGPVAFFTPNFWSRAGIADAAVSGMFLDAKPSQPNKAVQMETQYVPAWQGADSSGRLYARVAPTAFPQSEDGSSPVVHRISAYNRQALWDGVRAWFDGGAVASGRIDPGAAAVHQFTGQGGATWQIYKPPVPREQKVPIGWSTFATPAALDAETFGYRWDPQVTSKAGWGTGPLVQLPEYYRMGEGRNGRPQWQAVSAAEVPAETGLAGVQFERAQRPPTEPYVTPEESDSCWKVPGPKAGPFQAFPGDGSVVTYYWYRFADQPALLNADLSESEREEIQRRAELLHREWTKDREYLPPPARGSLADIDPALIVTPPAGLEIGYVPIVTRQGVAE
ncbi:MAG: hypothetical protein LW816_15305 [Planctomyces sp.]|nr:hypothetical protein [Planctomyces sp.]